MNSPTKADHTSSDSQKIIAFDRIPLREPFDAQNARLECPSLRMVPTTSDGARHLQTAMNGRAVNGNVAPFTENQEEEELPESTQDMLARLIAEGGGNHFLRSSRAAPPASTEQQQHGPSPANGSGGDGSIASSSRKRGAAKRKVERETAAAALENERRSTINKLLPQQRAIAHLRMAGLEGGRNEEMSVRAMMGTDGKRKRKQRVL